MASTSSFRGQQQVSSSYGGGPPPLPPSRNQRLYGKPLPHQLPQSSYERRPSSLSHSSSTSSLYSPYSRPNNNDHNNNNKNAPSRSPSPIPSSYNNNSSYSRNGNYHHHHNYYQQQSHHDHHHNNNYLYNHRQRLREAEAKLTESVRKSQIDLDKVNWELEKVIHQTALATRQIELLFANSQEEIEALNKLAEKETEENQLALINNKKSELKLEELPRNSHRMARDKRGDVVETFTSISAEPA
ncbi:11621_t:CDS:2 [Entrophospora sp. SA101]|nr:11621_t:CDS:2 [Entrophospora sp. SA101]CAJ0925182.1 12108_t:CDS:2 [Entrophospora sp. SA101]